MAIKSKQIAVHSIRLQQIAWKENRIDWYSNAFPGDIFIYQRLKYEIKKVNGQTKNRTTLWHITTQVYM